jgi:hypothetical protein
MNIWINFLGNESYAIKKRLTKRAPDAGDSAVIPSIFLRRNLFLAGRLRRPRPSAGNACRWVVPCKSVLINAYQIERVKLWQKSQKNAVNLEKK